MTEGKGTHGDAGESEGGAEEAEVEDRGDVRGGENFLGNGGHNVSGASLGGGHHGGCSTQRRKE